MERSVMAYTSVDDALNHLVRLQSTRDLTLSTKSHLQELKLELEFLRTFRSCLDYSNLKDLLKEIEKVANNAGRRLQFVRSTQTEYIAKEVHSLAPKVIKEIATLKPKIEGHIIDAVASVSRSTAPMLVIEFMDSLIENLKDLVNYQSQSSLPAGGEEVGALESKLWFLRNFLKFAAKRCSEHEKLKDLYTHAEAVTLEAACLSFMCSSDMTSSIKDKLAELLQKIEPATPEIRNIYVGVVQALKPLETETQISDVDLACFIQTVRDHVKEALSHPPTWMASLTVNTEALHEDLTFLSSYVMDPPMGFIESISMKDLQGKLGNWTSSDAHSLRHYTELSKLKGQLTLIEDLAIKVGCAFFSYFYVDDVKPVELKIALDDLVEKIKQIKEEVQVPLFTLPDVNVSRLDDLGFIRSLLRNLKEILDRQAGPITSLKHQMQEIFDNLKSLSSFLTDYGKKHHKNEELKKIATDIIFVAHRAEYVIDSLMVRDGPVWYHLLCVADITREMKRIRMEVMRFCDKIISDAKTESYEAETETLGAERDTPKTTATMPTYVANEWVVGLKDDIEDLIYELIRGSTDFDVLSIVGMGGVGKTTLAKRVYNDPIIVAHFDIRAFLTVSQQYDSQKLLLEILRNITGHSDTFDGRSFFELSDMVRKSLLGKRFLIVMDDVWDIEAWDVLSAPLPKVDFGSKILLTTRLDDVANYVTVDPGQQSIRHLQPLGEEQSWILLEKKIFQQESCPPKLKDLGMQIAKKAGGLPLVIVLVAGILVKAGKTVEHWMAVLESLERTRIGGNDDQGVYRIIGMSYQALPDCLRPCFLYFGALQQDDEIPTSKVISLWIAEGLIQQTERKSLEDVAMDYLMDLISSSLIMVGRKSSVDRVKSCRVHDVIHDFCLAKAKHENVYQLMDSYSKVSTLDAFDHRGADSSDYNIPNFVTCEHRRLFISSDWDDYISPRVSGSFVRSLVLTGRSSDFSMSPCDVSSLSQNFKLLRVLDLACINVGNTFPAGLEKMTLLRYLVIRGEMNYIPSSIGCLQQLETFVTIGLSGEIEIPDAIWSLTNLRQLHVTDRASFGGAPDNRRKFSSKLPNLRTMSTPFLCYGEDSEEIVRRLPSLEKLKCIILESWDSFTDKNLFPRLDLLTQLVSLKLFYYGRVRKSCEFNFPSNLRSLTISQFCLPWDQIAIIGVLPNLEILKLMNKAFEGRQWKVKDEQFPCLKLLRLDTLDVEVWHISADALPCLERLELQKCKKLKKIPDAIGDSASLKAIEVKWCSKSVEASAVRIKEYREEVMGDDQLNVIIHSIEHRNASAN